MADINRAIQALHLDQWITKAEKEHKANMANLRQGNQDSKGMDLKKQESIVQLAGQKSIAAATKDVADATKLLKSLGNSNDLKKTVLAPLDAIARKHNLTDAAIQKALKDAGFNIH